MGRRMSVVALLGAALIAPAGAQAAAPDGAGPWADGVVSTQQGKRADGGPVQPARSNPNDAVGVAENSNTTGFYSLGMGGTVTLSYDNNICNAGGADLDLELAEATVEPYQPELVDVFVSRDGTTFTKVATNVNKDAQLGLPPSVEVARFVRLVDKTATDNVKDRPTADGYDVDGVRALNTNCVARDVTCQATPLRVTFLNLQPIQSNPPEDPCADDEDTLLTVPNLTKVITAKTERDFAPGVPAYARSSVDDATILNQIFAETVYSEARVTCVGGAAVFSGSGGVENALILGMPISATGPLTISTPLADIWINRTIISATGVIQRGIEVQFKGLFAPLGTVVVSEAKAGVNNGLGSVC